jgi:hypothetical protein
MTYRNPIDWRLRKQRYRLTGFICQRCGAPVFTSRSHDCQLMIVLPPASPIEQSLTANDQFASIYKVGMGLNSG